MTRVKAVSGGLVVPKRVALDWKQGSQGELELVHDSFKGRLAYRPDLHSWVFAVWDGPTLLATQRLTFEAYLRESLPNAGMAEAEYQIACREAAERVFQLVVGLK